MLLKLTRSKGSQNDGFITTVFSHDLGYAVWYLIKAVIVIVPLTLVVAYVTLAERRILGFHACADWC